MQKNLEAYRFNDVTGALYEFIWHKYCDWYLEISKLSEDKVTTNKVLVKVLKGCLKLLHPVMPFITEEIWQKMPDRDNEWIMMSTWPEAEEKYDDAEAGGAMEKLIKVVTAIRNIRAFWNISHRVKLDVMFDVGDESDRALIEENSRYVERLAGCSICETGVGITRPEQSVAALTGGMKVYVPLGETVDVEKETGRINATVEELERYLNSIDKKLNNASFTDKAPADVVEKERDKKHRFSEQLNDLKDNLAALK